MYYNLLHVIYKFVTESDRHKSIFEINIFNNLELNKLTCIRTCTCTMLLTMYVRVTYLFVDRYGLTKNAFVQNLIDLNKVYM